MFSHKNVKKNEYGFRVQFQKSFSLIVSFQEASRAEMTDETWMTPYWPLEGLQSGLCSLLACLRL